MSFDFTSLITDRTQADLSELKALLSKPMHEWTEAETAWFNTAVSKGAYNYTDLNCVTACVEYLIGELNEYGYSVPYEKIEIQHPSTGGGGGGSRLPEGYTELKYIEGTGTQYIDTGIQPSEDLITTIEITPNQSALSENAILGSSWSITGYFLMFYQSKIRWHSKGSSVDISLFDKTGKNIIVVSPTSKPTKSCQELKAEKSQKILPPKIGAAKQTVVFWWP